MNAMIFGICVCILSINKRHYNHKRHVDSSHNGELNFNVFPSYLWVLLSFWCPQGTHLRCDTVSYCWPQSLLKITLCYHFPLISIHRGSHCKPHHQCTFWMHRLRHYFWSHAFHSCDHLDLFTLWNCPHKSHILLVYGPFPCVSLDSSCSLLNSHIHHSKTRKLLIVYYN